MKKRSPAAFLPGFTYKERIAVLSLLVTMSLLLLAPAQLPDTSSPGLSDTVRLSSLLLPGPPAPEYPASGIQTNDHSEAPVLFYFDPNTLDSAGWLRLGLREKTVRTLMRFRRSGGQFRSAEDLDRIYGLFPNEAARIRPYVRLKPPQHPAPVHFTGKKAAFRTPRILDINAADSTALESLPGIGPRLAARIVSFRQKLGGFHRVEQVAETYGLPDSTYQKIRPLLQITEPVALRRIRINKATMEELAQHPYIRYKLARIIIAYRQQHGPFKTLNDLRHIVQIDEMVLQKLIPYLDAE